MRQLRKTKVHSESDLFLQLKVTLAMAPIVIFATAFVVSHGLKYDDTHKTKMTEVIMFQTEIASTQRSINLTVMDDDKTLPIKEIGYIFYTPDYESMNKALQYTSLTESPVVTGTISAEIIYSYTGAKQQCFTYMGWQMITSTTSRQYKWRNEHFPDWNSVYGSQDAFDSEGFGIVDGRYVVAMSSKADGGLASIGQYVDVILTNGITIPCVVGEVKSCSDANWTIYGHMADSASISIVEFCVDKELWYTTDHANPGTSAFHPEWAAPLDYIVLY